MKYNGAEIIIKLLSIHGIRQIAGIPGGANLPMYHALAAYPEIRHVLARHEQGAGFIAQGQARSTNKPAVFFATSGPGATNALTAIADAKLDSIPIIAITGQVPSGLIGTDAFQEIDTYGLTVPITKHNYLVRSAAELLEVIPEAFQIAIEGRPGPVVIDVPKDVQMEEIEIESWPQPWTVSESSGGWQRDASALIEMLQAAHKPVLYVGGGAIQSGASERIREWVEYQDLPIVSSLMGLGTVPTDQDQFYGMIGMHAARYTNMILEECDALIGLGVRFDDRATGKLAEFCPNAKIAHIDIDASEIGKLLKPEVSIHEDLKEVFGSDLLFAGHRERKQWNERCRYLRDEFPLELPQQDKVCSPYGILKQLEQMLPDDYIVTTDVGQHQMRVAQCFPFDRPQQWLTSGGLGTMGFGLPAAIGAAMENSEATVICVTGDGSLLMNIQELALIAEEQLNVKILLCNNQSLGLVHQQQRLFYDKRVFASIYNQYTDFVGIARSFGVDGVDLGIAEDPAEMLQEAMESPHGCLIHVPINVSEHVLPMVPPGASNKDMLFEQEELATTGGAA